MIRRSSILASTALLLGALSSCDTNFGPRPIGGGAWEGTQARVHASADVAWPIVEATLEELGAGKSTPYPEGSETGVRVTYNERWVKVAVDPARPYASVLSAYAMNDLESGQDLVRDLVAALRAQDIRVDEPSYRDEETVAHQRLERERSYAEAFVTSPYDHGDGHDDDHGDHGDGHDGQDEHGDDH